MKERKLFKKDKTKKFYSIVIMVIAILAVLTITVGNEHQTDKMIAFGAGSTLVPTGVNNTLNITFSDVTYSTVAPAFEFERGNYAQNAIWDNSGANVVNATYLVMQNNNTTGSNTGFSQVQYNVTPFNKNSDYFFMETKIASNLTGLSGMSIVLFNASNEKSVVSTSLISSAKASLPKGSVVINITSAGNVGLSANESAVLSTKVNTVNDSGTDVVMNSLNFYDLTVYVYKDTSKTSNITVSVINPANGNVVGTAELYGVSGVNYTRLNYTAIQYEGTYNSAMILDWGYFVFASPSASSVVSTSVMPYIAGAGSNVMSNLNIAPFDPSAIANETYTVRS